MKNLKQMFVFALAVLVLGGCASKGAPSGPMQNDWRTGTNQSPYRSIVPAIVCDDCKL